MNLKLARALVEALQSGQQASMATLIEARGSVPQVLGAKMIVLSDGTIAGTVGGGAVEHEVSTRLLERCSSPRPPERYSVDLTKDLGMCCGGGMVFLMENVAHRERLIIFGAGHVARPTAEFALRAGFSVTVVDDREALNTEERFPGCEVMIAEPAEASELLRTNEQDYLLAVTHDHRLDEEALRAFAVKPHRYFGLIGSTRKVHMIRQRIRARGIELNTERFYGPVGIDVGAETPEEIAISIVGELIAVRRGHASAHMRIKIQEPEIP